MLCHENLSGEVDYVPPDEEAEAWGGGAGVTCPNITKLACAEASF